MVPSTLRAWFRRYATCLSGYLTNLALKPIVIVPRLAGATKPSTQSPRTVNSRKRVPRPGADRRRRKRVPLQSRKSIRKRQPQKPRSKRGMPLHYQCSRRGRPSASRVWAGKFIKSFASPGDLIETLQAESTCGIRKIVQR